MGLGNFFTRLVNAYNGTGPVGVFEAGSFDGTSAISPIDSAVRITMNTISRGTLIVEGEYKNVWEKVLTRRRFLQAVVQDVLYNGNYIAEIVVDVGQGELIRGGHFDVTGKNAIRYKVDFPFPDDHVTRNLSADEVCHVTTGALESSPWAGVSPFAGTELVRLLTRSLLNQASWPALRLFTMPGPEYPSAGPGSRLQGVGAGEATVRGDSEKAQDRFGKPGQRIVRNLNSRGGPIPVPIADAIFKPDQWTVTLRKQLVDEVFDCVGIPPVMRGDATPGMAYKTALSEWVDGWLQPFCDGIAEQLTDALEVEVKIDLAPAKIPAVETQAKALSDLVGAGMSLEEAKTIVGI